MNKITVTRRASFEACYLMKVDNVSGVQIHSHNYKVEVTVSGNQRMTDNGFIIEFKVLKNMLESILPDHKFIFWPIDDPTDYTVSGISSSIQNEIQRLGNTCYDIDFAPTAENMISHIVSQLQNLLDKHYPGVTIVNAKLRENNDSFAEWSKS